MRLRALLGLAAVAMALVSLSACQGAVSPPVDNAEDLEQLLLPGQMLTQVTGFMTDRLRTRIMLYPAKKIEQDAITGGWALTALEGAVPGDMDAPHHVLMITPDRAGDQFFAVFFKDKVVMDSEWIADSNATIIRQLLTNTLPTQ